VTHVEKNLKVFEAIGFADVIATAKSNIADAKSKYESGNNEEVLKAKKRCMNCVLLNMVMSNITQLMRVKPMH
jgi:hypothetical protein